jgi:hypothetical protein
MEPVDLAFPTSPPEAKRRRSDTTCEHVESSYAIRFFCSDGWTGYSDFVALMVRDMPIPPAFFSPFF